MMTHEIVLTRDLAEKLIRKSGPRARGSSADALPRRFAGI
jgi:hypothetical protein